MFIILLIESIITSTLLYYYLHFKTRISKKYLYIDNVGVILLSFLLSYLIYLALPYSINWLAYFINVFLIFAVAFSFTMIRFWRTPKRITAAKDSEILSPADGNVIYIKKIDPGETPISIKKRRISKLDELTKTELLQTPCWLIGINMTPFDVHKNCAPIQGMVILQKYFAGKFLSLKENTALAENERNTFVFKNNNIVVGIVQIASRLVRKIDVYVNQGQLVQRGDWVGMIRFGSQVDVIIPSRCKVLVKEKDQIFAGQTVIAELEYEGIS
ncbi:MAG: phosphatidylserine decarboxylase [Candidatus Cyclobacteriaceae bacterium M3_2C_046]